MKKLFIIPALILLFSAGVTSSKVEPQPILIKEYSSPINTRLDSVNVKVIQLRDLMKQL
ncbi:hypothetical protein ATK78_1286 [Pedobacter metabolipauper]|uniref:Uncharacterized protein n=1 Tax=Pedobacter metabolipauper TaxID=425513 RepID=A0A4R6SZR5_9SPHI|nr:hypothetical protein ATK78_1286 [Pedobacter metabolipauper]